MHPPTDDMPSRPTDMDPIICLGETTNGDVLNNLELCVVFKDFSSHEAFSSLMNAWYPNLIV
jgi:hypothetical protein